MLELLIPSNFDVDDAVVTAAEVVVVVAEVVAKDPVETVEATKSLSAKFVRPIEDGVGHTTVFRSSESSFFLKILSSSSSSSSSELNEKFASASALLA